MYKFLEELYEYTQRTKHNFRQDFSNEEMKTKQCLIQLDKAWEVK